MVNEENSGDAQQRNSDERRVLSGSIVLTLWSLVMEIMQSRRASWICRLPVHPQSCNQFKCRTSDGV